MELIAGASLRPRSTKAPLPRREVAAIGAKVATALHDLHRQHVIHLDVKPSNVMRARERRGRADRFRPVAPRPAARPAGGGVPPADRHRRPTFRPSRCMGDRSDPRSDLFALGVMLYFLATGERPFGEPAGRARPAPAAVARPGAAARGSTRPSRPGCRRSSCAASRSIRTSAPATAAQLAFELRIPDAGAC